MNLVFFPTMSMNTSSVLEQMFSSTPGSLHRQSLCLEPSSLSSPPFNSYSSLRSMTDCIFQRWSQQYLSSYIFFIKYDLDTPPLD